MRIGEEAVTKSNDALFYDSFTDDSSRSDALVSAADPIGDQVAVLLARLLPCELTCGERMDLAVREEVMQLLVVRPWHEVIIATRDNLGRRAIVGRRSRKTGFCSG